MPPTRYPDAARIYAMDTATHTMTVLHDDGLYRHLRFRRPDTGMYWFDLVTWPGCLTINGDAGTFVFSRVRDMIEFFDGDDINPGYWGEKVQGDCDSIREHSADRFTRYVTEAFREYANTHGWVLTQVRDLWDEITDEILDSWDFSQDDERAARDAVSAFTWASDMNDEVIEELPPFRFIDSWDWDTRDFRHLFLWCCFAVHRGVNQYRVLKGLATPLPPLEFPDPQPAAPTAQAVTRQTIVTPKTKEGIL